VPKDAGETWFELGDQFTEISRRTCDQELNRPQPTAFLRWDVAKQHIDPLQLLRIATEVVKKDRVEQLP
jgi:hypothetical protein